jgi:DNA-binding NtrC family response regulator
MAETEADPPVLAVLTLTESFAAEWDGVARTAGLGLRVGTEPSEIGPLGEAVALLVGAAGREFDVADDLSAARGDATVATAVVGADPGHRAGVAALRGGADEYFALPQDYARLVAWVQAQAAAQAASQRARARTRAERLSYDFGAILGESEQLREALERAARAIPADRATVLLTGETGTGKELIAQAIHYNGARAANPFVEINCSALPATLLEAELFGYEKGAFTDARTAKPGLFEAAHGGTLFLDEIGELRLDLQAKLLRALEERSVRRLGGIQSRPVDVRIIAATHVHLPTAVEGGDFRSDLFYRLNVVTIHLPPLRRRGADVLLLARHFLRTIAEEYGLEPPELDREAAESLLRRPWPGNVRELRNAMERGVVLGGPTLTEDDLFAEPTVAMEDHPLPFPATIEEIEIAAARAALARHRGNKSAAARALGISRSRLYRLLGEDDAE